MTPAQEDVAARICRRHDVPVPSMVYQWTVLDVALHRLWVCLRNPMRRTLAAVGRRTQR